MSKTFKLKLVAPDGVKYNEDATEVLLPTSNGQIAILADHASLITVLKPGEIIIKNGSKEDYLSTDGGTVEVHNNLVKILADTAERAENLDEMAIVEAQKKAKERMEQAKNDTEYADAYGYMEKQLARLSFIKKRKRNYRI